LNKIEFDCEEHMLD